MVTTALSVLHSCTGVAAPQEGEFVVLSSHWESWTRECISDVFGSWQSDLTAWLVGFKLLFHNSVRIAHGSNQRPAICRFELQGEPTELEATSIKHSFWKDPSMYRFSFFLCSMSLLQEPRNAWLTSWPITAIVMCFAATPAYDRCHVALMHDRKSRGVGRSSPLLTTQDV